MGMCIQEYAECREQKSLQRVHQKLNLCDALTMWSLSLLEEMQDGEATLLLLLFLRNQED